GDGFALAFRKQRPHLRRRTAAPSEQGGRRILPGGRIEALGQICQEPAAIGAEGWAVQPYRPAQVQAAGCTNSCTTTQATPALDNRAIDEAETAIDLASLGGRVEHGRQPRGSAEGNGLLQQPRRQTPLAMALSD